MHLFMAYYDEDFYRKWDIHVFRLEVDMVEVNLVGVYKASN